MENTTMKAVAHRPLIHPIHYRVTIIFEQYRHTEIQNQVVQSQLTSKHKNTISQNMQNQLSTVLLNHIPLSILQQLK